MTYEMATEITNNLDVDIYQYATLAKLPPAQMLNIKELANCLGCSTRTIGRWYRCGQLPPPVKIGKEYIWTVKQIHDWFDRQLKYAEEQASLERKRLANFEFRK